MRQLPFGAMRGVALALLLALAYMVPSAVAGGAARTADGGCGEVRAQHAFYAVTARGSVSCGPARRVLRKFMGGGGVKHGGPYAYEEWWSLGAWRCSRGAGGYTCFRGGANYESARASMTAEWVAWECGYKPAGATVPCRKG